MLATHDTLFTGVIVNDAFIRTSVTECGRFQRYRNSTLPLVTSLNRCNLPFEQGKQRDVIHPNQRKYPVNLTVHAGSQNLLSFEEDFLRSNIFSLFIRQPHDTPATGNRHSSSCRSSAGWHQFPAIDLISLKGQDQRYISLTNHSDSIFRAGCILTGGSVICGILMQY
jgi:hypothetical protein